MNLMRVVVAVVAGLSGPVVVAGERVALLADFEDQRVGEPRPAIRYWKWTAQQKARAAEYSSLQVVGDGAGGRHALQLTVTDKLPWTAHGRFRVLKLCEGLLPPRADAVRMTLKPLDGKMTLTVGGPTVYFGHSDVTAEPRTLDAVEDDGWRTIEFSLNHGLRRNLRRAGLGRRSPVIYYTRWIQEPLFLTIVKPSSGRMLIDDVELISRGEGQSYPTFERTQIRRVAPIADFETPADMQRTFTWFSSPHGAPSFDGPPALARRTWKPPQMRRIQAGGGEGGAWQVELQGFEEVCFAGIHVRGTAGANAMALRLKVDHPEESFRQVALDFLAMVAGRGDASAFPWEALRPPAAWRKAPEVAFTYYLMQNKLTGVSFGWYHLRRAVARGTWTTLVLPLTDFVCAYGQGGCEALFRRQQPLRGESVIALLFVPPYRQRSGVTRVLIDELSFVKVPGETASLRSFWQVPDVSRVRLIEANDGVYGGVRQVPAGSATTRQAAPRH